MICNPKGRLTAASLFIAFYNFDTTSCVTSCPFSWDSEDKLFTRLICQERGRHDGKPLPRRRLKEAL